MSIELVLYGMNFISNLNWIIHVINFFTIVIIWITIGITGLQYASNCENGNSEFKDSYLCAFLVMLKKNIKWLILLFLISTFLPSEKTMYLMIGANYFKNSSLPPKVEMLIEKKLDEYLIEPIKIVSKEQ